MNTTLVSLADDADLLFAGLSYPRNPPPMSRSITTFRWPRCITVPMRPNGQVVFILPSPLARYLQ